jgi:hypothetical protein
MQFCNTLFYQLQKFKLIIKTNKINNLWIPNI